MEIKIGNISFSKDNISLPPSEVWTLITHGLIYLTAIIGIFISPLPAAILPHAIKVYILTVSSSLSALLQGIKPYTTNTQNTVK